MRREQVGATEERAEPRDEATRKTATGCDEGRSRAELAEPGKIAGLVLAAGSSRRLGQPKQLLPYQGRTLLDASLDRARKSSFAQRLVTVGGSAELVRDSVDLSGFEVVESVNHTEGCSSSIVSALDMIHPDTDGLVLMLGDQPGVSDQAIEMLVSTGLNRYPIATCRYEDGVGHPFWFSKEMFPALAELHGDKAVWKLIESGDYPVGQVGLAGNVPLDVDTWEDYEALLAQGVPT